MGFTNFRKESSERSDSLNWAKRLLVDNTSYNFDSIEGCNQNTSNVVTHLIERARVDFDGSAPDSDDAILQHIIELEGVDALSRKMNFAAAFGLKLSYALYCDEQSKVWLYSINSISNCSLVSAFSSYADFSAWISSIKGWVSKKAFREKDDLPYFDKELRRFGTPWPTNIDCFVSNNDKRPVAIIEFQNARNTSVAAHCNNEFFLCKQSYVNENGITTYHDDIRRWISQEILRVQSNLRLFVITWSQSENDFVLKEIETITFPNLPYSNNWTLTSQYKAALHKFANAGTKENAADIANSYSTFSLRYEDEGNTMQKVVHRPPLSSKDKSFPWIYYSFKQFIQGDRASLPNLFNRLMEEKVCRNC